MFFAISKRPDPRFAHHEPLGSWVFSHDDGWKLEQGSWIKGYHHTQINHGLWTRLRLCDDTVYLEHSRYRGYPLWWDSQDQVLTNLLGKGRSIWADVCVKLDHTGIHSSLADVIGPIEQKSLSKNQVSEWLANNLTSKIRALQQDYTNCPVKLFVTGGTDTMLLWCALQACAFEFELVDYEFFQYDWFTNHNIWGIKQQHWAYKQIHHWTEPTILVTGSQGDEFLFRGPETVALWCSWHDLNLLDLARVRPGYHTGYYLLEKNQKVFTRYWQERKQIQERLGSYQDLTQQILNINANDHQHWHLGHTLTWSPFLDLEITKAVLNMSYDDVVDHILDASVSKLTMDLLYPGISQSLLGFKNQNSRRHLNNWVGAKIPSLFR